MRDEAGACGGAGCSCGETGADCGGGEDGGGGAVKSIFPRLVLEERTRGLPKRSLVPESEAWNWPAKAEESPVEATRTR